MPDLQYFRTGDTRQIHLWTASEMDHLFRACLLKDHNTTKPDKKSGWFWSVENLADLRFESLPQDSQTLEKILDLPQQEIADHSKLYLTERLSDCINLQIDPARNNKEDPVVGSSLKPHMVKDSCHYFCAAPSWVQLWLNVKQDDLTCEKTR